MNAAAHLFTLEPLERNPGRSFAVVGVVLVIAYLTAWTAFPRSQGRILNGDAIQYYAYLRSIAIDHDVDFTNDYQLLYSSTAQDQPGNMWLTSRTDTGVPPNMMSIGPALLWAPFFLAISAMLVILRPFGVYVPWDGLAAPFQLSAGVAGIVYATLGAYLCYRCCRHLFGIAPSFWGALAAWLATPAVYYSLVSPAYSHAPSLFASALFCHVWLSTRDRDDLRRYVWLGLLAGLAALVRWQEAVILVLPVSDLVRSRVMIRSRLPGAALRVGVMVCGVIVMVLPQMLAWRAIYGHFLVIPAGGGFMQWASPALVSVLFSLNHGLFTWTPAVLVAILGLYCLVRRDASAGWPIVLVVLLSVYINASVSDWWAGAAFGARRFVGNTVFFALGFAALFASEFWQARPAFRRCVASALVAYNLLFLLQYQLFMRGFQVPYPTTVREVFVDRLVLPLELLRAWLHG